MIDDLFNQRLTEILDIFHLGGNRNHAIHVFACAGAPEELDAACRSTPPDGALILLCQSPPVAAPAPTGQAPCLVIEWPLGGNEAALAKLSLALGALKAVKVVKGAAPATLAARRGEWEELERTIDDMLMGIHHERLSRLPRSRCSIQNLRWLPRNPRLAARLASPGIPVVVCGAGPSSATQFDLLRKFADRAVIVTVGRMAERLAAAGIIPDFCVMVDQEAADDVSRVLPKQSALVCLSSLSPVVVEQFETRLWRHGDDLFSGVGWRICNSLWKLSPSPARRWSRALISPCRCRHPASP